MKRLGGQHRMKTKEIGQKRGDLKAKKSNAGFCGRKKKV
jgi:hypothetical protein